MNSISQKSTYENNISSTIKNFFIENKISQIMAFCNFNKEKGISCSQIFMFIFSIVFTGRNFLYNLEKNSLINFGKDTVYRFLNSVHFNWSRLLLLLAIKTINFIKSLISQKRVTVLIVDDSVYSRNKSKNVELLTRVRDHCENKYVKGFRMLTLGWSDGNSFIPFAFNLLSSVNKTNVLNSMNNEIDKRTNGYKRRLNSMVKEPDAMCELLKDAKNNGINADFVLFDSWFAHPATIKNLKEMGFQSIAMLKTTPKIYYEFNGKLQSLSQIYKVICKKRGKAKIISSVIAAIDNGNIPVKLVFVRDRNKKRNWLAILSTDVNLSSEEIVQIYSKRWNIEVFFKCCKSYLNLAKEFFCRNYDALVAHTTIVFARYIMLTIENRKNKDQKTFGALFNYYCDELQEMSKFEAIQILLQMLKSALKTKLMLTKKELNAFFDEFMASLPSYFKGFKLLRSCES